MTRYLLVVFDTTQDLIKIASCIIQSVESK